jgi:hypothetical protein
MWWEEKRQQRGADVQPSRPHRHDDDLVVAQFGHVKIVFSNASAQRSDQAANLLVAQHLVVRAFSTLRILPSRRIA